MATSTEEQTGSWNVICQNPNCDQEYLYQEFDPFHPMAFDVFRKPQKPRIGKVVCPHCQMRLPYRPAHLKFEVRSAA